MSSVTFYKYSGSGFGDKKPLELGQKHAVIMDLERNVQGYKALRQEINELRFNHLEKLYQLNKSLF